MTEPTPIIVFDHVVKEFKQRGGNAASGRGATVARAVDDVSLTINEGDIFGIIGYSGAGKSTLVRLINALEKPTSGTVTVLDTEVSALSEAKLRPIRQKIGMIFQQFNLFSTKTVAQNIAYPLQLDHWRKDYQDRRVSQLLEFVGLSEHANNCPEARNSVSASPGPWPPIRRFCLRMRRQVRWIPKPPWRCCPCSGVSTKNWA